MLPHLQNVEKGIKNINNYLDKISKGAQLDESGRCRLQLDQVGVHVVAVPGEDLLIFKAFINFLPDPATGKLLPLYYHLLDMNDNPETGIAHFAIVASEEVGSEQDMICVEVKRTIVDVSFEEFSACLKSVGEVANAWMPRLVEEFEASLIP
jgi:hypothetical protein